MATCQRCRGDIDADAMACPHCGWEPRSRGHLGLVALVGVALTLTGVGAVVGLPLIAAAAYLNQTRRDDRPAEVAPA